MENEQRWLKRWIFLGGSFAMVYHTSRWNIHDFISQGLSGCPRIVGCLRAVRFQIPSTMRWSFRALRTDVLRFEELLINWINFSFALQIKWDTTFHLHFKMMFCTSHVCWWIFTFVSCSWRKNSSKCSKNPHEISPVQMRFPAILPIHIILPVIHLYPHYIPTYRLSNNSHSFFLSVGWFWNPWDTALQRSIPLNAACHNTINERIPLKIPLIILDNHHQSWP